MQEEEGAASDISKTVCDAYFRALALFDFTGKRMRHPLLASVFYLSDHGGPTLVVDQRITEDGMGCVMHLHEAI